MKRNLYPLFSFLFILNGFFSTPAVHAQGGVYFREGFAEGTGWPSSALSSVPFQEVVTTTSGSWYTFGGYRSNGPTGSCIPQTGDPSHIRFANLPAASSTYTLDDSAFIITPLASAGIFDLTYLNGRSGRRITIYKTPDSDPNTSNWVQVVHFPTSGYVNCDLFTVMVNDVNAKRLKIVARSGTDSDLDTMVMRSIGVLPARFGGLTVQQRNDEVVATWDTYNEASLRGYYLQKSTDGNSFTDVTFIPAKNIQVADYTATDKVKGASNIFYRVKSVDLDGKTGFSPVARISVNRQGFDGVIIKNPARGNTVEVQLNGLQPGTYQVSLNGVSGNRLATQSVRVQGASTTVSMQLPATTGKGLQIITISGNNFRHTGKVMVE